MVDIRALAKGLLGGRKAAKTPPKDTDPDPRRIRGWVRLHSDNVIRGWARDEADPTRRLTVRIFIDDKAVADLVADRYEAVTEEAGRGDGFHGFALVVPQAYRDGREHSFKALFMEAAHRLKAKALTFVIDPAASPPRLHLVEFTPTHLRARMRGGQYAKDAPLELWSGGHRLDPALTTTHRLGEGPQAELRLDYPRETFLGLGADAQVAAAGMAEAGAGAAALWSAVRLQAAAAEGGLALWLDGPLSLDGGTALIRVFAADDARLLVSQDMALGPDPVMLALPAGAPTDGARVEVTLGGREIAALTAVVGEDAAAADGAQANLIRNAELTDWPNGVLVRGGPARFEIARGWHARNAKSHASFRAMAFPLDQEGEACSLTLAVPTVEDFCRLEAEVESRASLGGRRLRLSFEAGVAHGPLEAFRAPDDFAQIERIFLTPAGGGEVVTIARTVLLTREMRRFDFEFEAPADFGAGPISLAFDFKRAFAVTLQRPSLALAGRVADAAALAFEDPAIAAQAALLEGFGDWLSVRVVTPAASPPLDHPVPRWEAPPAGQGSVEVVVCMHDAADETIDCLRSLVAGSRLPHLVRIVDDASGEDSRRRIEAYIADKPWMRLDPNPAHLGYTASANRGVRASTADWVILLNSDTLVSEGWIEGLLQAADSDPKVALAGPLSNAASFQSVPEVVDAAGKLAVNPLPPGWTVERMAALVRETSEPAFPELPLLNGFCTLIRRQAFLDVGGFDEAAFPMGYGEENDLCLRLGAAGWKLVVADQVYVHHKKSASFGAERRAALQAEGTAALKRLHPGLDLAALTGAMRRTPALKAVRARVRAAWAQDAG